jgi:hypothetical protein
MKPTRKRHRAKKAKKVLSHNETKRKSPKARAAKGHRGHKKNLNPNSGSGFPTAVSNVSPDVIAPIHYVAFYAESAGWPVKAAFECGMQLLCHGVTIQEAERMFRHCERWRQ